MKIVILDGSAANPGDITWKALENLGEVTAYDITSKDQLIDLKYIGVLATGYNVVDLQAARDHGVTVTNVPEYATFATAQHTMALLLELTNLASLHSASVMDGDWVRCPQFCYFKGSLTELAGKTLHIIGLGKIGKRVAQMAYAFGMTVTATPHDASLIGTTVDVSGTPVKCLALEDGINKNTLSWFNKGTILINVARGPVINEADVRAALNSGLLGGFGCDVVCVEPMLESNPLLGAPNCIITPHIAWTPVETRIRLIDMAAANLKAFMDGEPINKVN